jgi:hypothetical protein
MIRIMLLIVALVAAFAIYQAHENKKCHDMALKAATEEIRPDSFPNAQTREAMQEDYIRKYMESCRQ